MRRLELPPKTAKQLISDEQTESMTYRLLRAGFYLAALGVVGFLIGFFYQKSITAAGLPYREAQAGAILVVFIGFMLFTTSASRLGISTRKLTYNRVLAILRNEVELPYDEEEGLRKKVANSLSSLGEGWTLYPTIFSADPQRRIPMVVTGPAGVYTINIIYTDPQKKGFVDPMPALLAGTAELEKRLGQPVQPVISFFRNKKKYKITDERVKAYTLPELHAHLSSRPVHLTPADLARIDPELRELSRLPRA